MNFKEYDNYDLEYSLGMTHSQYGRLYILTNDEVNPTQFVWRDLNSTVPLHHWSLSLPITTSGNVNFYDKGYIPMRLSGQTIYGGTDHILSNINSTEFDGLSTSFLKCDMFNNPQVTYIDSYSVSVWIKMDEFIREKSKCSILNIPSVNGRVGDIIDVNSNKIVIYFFGYNIDIDFQYHERTLYSILANNWCHIVYGVDGKKGGNNDEIYIKYFLYINGICYSDDDNIVIIPYTNYIIEKIDSWYVGIEFTNNETFIGNMEDLRFYDKSLTIQEITFLYNQGRGTSRQCLFNGYPTLKEPKYWFKCNEPYGSMIHQTGIKTNEVINIHNVTINQSGIVDTYPYLYPSSDPPVYNIAKSIEILNSGIYMQDANINDAADGLWSFSTWLYYEGGSYDQLILSNFSGITTNNTGEFCIYINSGGIYLNFYKSVNVNVNIGEIKPNDWYHIVFVSDNTKYFRYCFYINGLLMISDITSSLYLTTNSSISIGDIYGGGATFTDKLQDIRIYNYALSYQEVKNIYNNGYGLYY